MKRIAFQEVEVHEEQVVEILQALKKIQYGSIEITIHASKIVQIETREKVRFEKCKASK